MKRFHVHVGVENIEESIRFYSALFGAEPVKIKADYAKWLLNEPHVNFAVSTRASQKGVDHLGIQVDEDGELDEIRARLNTANLTVFDEGKTICCYAKSDKTWIQDPSGVAWETYRTMDDAQIFAEKAVRPESACCTPETIGTSNCCEPSDTTAGCCA